MTHDLGDVVALRVEIRDAAGALANAGSVSLVVTLPDDTTSGSLTPSNPSTGVYTYNYTPTQSGRHVGRWVATGQNASSVVDVFDVREPSPPYIVSLADVKSHLNITTTDAARDEELRRFIESATTVIEDHVGPVVVRTYIERHSAGRYLYPRKTPVVSITSITPWLDTGSTYLAADVTVSSTGRIELLDGGSFTGGPFRLEYKAGRRVIEARYTEAALELVRVNYRPQKGGNASRYDRGEGDVRPDLGFFIPHGVLALLGVKPGTSTPFWVA